MESILSRVIAHRTGKVEPYFDVMASRCCVTGHPDPVREEWCIRLAAGVIFAVRRDAPAGHFSEGLKSAGMKLLHVLYGDIDALIVEAKMALNSGDITEAWNYLSDIQKAIRDVDVLSTKISRGEPT